MAQELEDLFNAGTLVRPTDRKANLVHLVRALATVSGVEDFPRSDPVDELIKVIGPTEHVVFVLLDGLGMNIVRRLPEDSFLRQNLKGELNATCPSTTACALTSVATAAYPNRHCVTGWFTHLPEFGITAMILPFAERFSNQPLIKRGIRPEDVLPLTPVCAKMKREALTLVPAYIANTTYNVYSRGGTEGMGYESLTDGISKVIQHVMGAEGPTYTHLYLHDIDTLCHHVGINHDTVVPLVMGIDSELERLGTALAGRARIVVTADHGLIDVPKPDQALLLPGEAMLELLVVPPSGDARMPIFHVKEGMREAFAALFRERYGDRMVLVDVDDAERMELFGPGAMSPVARRRFGDFIAIPFKPATLAFHPAHKPVTDLYLAVHAGLSVEEMTVPLCVA
jgi:hypothetical protein